VHKKTEFWQQAASCIQSITFEFQTLADINSIIGYLTQWLPDESPVTLGLKELMVNAVEHGNLGIGYTLKTQLLQQGTWLEEIEKRLQLPENKLKKAILQAHFSLDSLQLSIQDQGQGFDYQKYMRPQKNTTTPHGRGLVLAKNMAFATLKFKAKGRRVEATALL